MPRTPTCPDCGAPVAPTDGICPRCLADIFRPGAATIPPLRLQGPEFSLEIGASQSIGRNSGGREFLSRFREISREHAQLSLTNGLWSVQDLGSRNGTFLNGIRLKPGREYRLKNGDRLGLSDEVELEVVIMAQG